MRRNNKATPGKMERLFNLWKKGERTIVGLMSGTSHDGTDAAVVRIKGSGTDSQIRLVHHNTYPYPDKLRDMIGRAFNGTAEEICSLNFELGRIFADAALRSVKEAGLLPYEVDLIASHGQTIHHIPPSGQLPGSTLQIGEGSVIAEITGIITVSDFRTRDMAVGGQGAPLVSLADYLLFHEKGVVTAVQNIGGIANLTVVPESMDDIMAFDTGPGNSLIDEVVKIVTDGTRSFDMDGEMAAKGKIDTDLLRELMHHPYLSVPPPKSTGRELFGRDMASLLATLATSRRRSDKRSPEDLVATLTLFTAASIADAYERFVFPRYDLRRVIICGGGSRNPVLIDHLRRLFKKTGKKGMKIALIDKFGIPSGAKEALSFAVLGNETVSGNPGNIPQATGAGRGVVLGKISL